MGVRRRNAGGVWRPSNTKIWQIDFWYRGTRYLKSSGTANVAEAKRAAKAWRSQVAGNGSGVFHRRVGVITFGAAAIKYWETIGYGTVNASSLWAQIKRAEEIIGHDRPVCEIGDIEMLELRKAFATLPAARTMKLGVRQNSAINDFTRLVYRVINFASIFMDETMPRMPVPARFLLAETWRMRELSYDEEAALDGMKRQDLVPLWKFLIETGLRRGAACTLTWNQVDFALKKIIFIEKGKTKPKHVVPLSDYALGILQSLQQNHPVWVFTIVAEQAHMYKGSLRKAGTVIPVAPSYFGKQMRMAFKDAGITNFTVQDFRHTAATRLLRACGNLVIVQKFLGHTTTKQTQRYVHMVEEDVAGAVEMLNVARRAANREMIASIESLANDATPELLHIAYAVALRRQLDARRQAGARIAA